MKRYLPVLSMVVLIVFVLATSTFGRYDPLLNRQYIEPEIEEHPWGGDGLNINNGGNNGGTYIFTPTPFFYVSLALAFDYIIILSGDIDVSPNDNKLMESKLPSDAGNVTAGGAVSGKGN